MKLAVVLIFAYLCVVQARPGLIDDVVNGIGDVVNGIGDATSVIVGDLVCLVDPDGKLIEGSCSPKDTTDQQ